MTMLALYAAVAIAAPPPEGVYPTLASADAPAQWREAGHAGALACDPLWPNEVLVCFRVQEGKKRRLVTDVDLAKWGVDARGLRAIVAERAKAALATQPVAVPIEGTSFSYWRAAEGDGWSAAGVLVPEALAAKLGGPFLVAVPTDRVLVAWKPGQSDLDKIVAVGVKEMYEAADWPVSPVVHLWDGRAWSAFVEAVPAPAPPPDLVPVPR